MHMRTKWASGDARMDSHSVGPKHDPYSRSVVTLTLKGKEVTLYQCALAGDWIVVDGVKTESAESPLKTKEESRAALEEYEAYVTKVTGFPSLFWFDILWGKLNESRYRRDPAAYEMQQAMDRAFSSYE